MNDKKDVIGDSVVQPEVIKELQETNSEDLLVEYGTQGRDDNEKTRFIEKWFPREEQWQGKTVISGHQSRALAVLRNITEYFDEIEDVEGFLQSVIEDYEIYQTSVEGESRAQHVAILRAMFGADTSEEQTNAAFRNFIAGQANNEDSD